jgi:hypothetical protein
MPVNAYILDDFDFYQAPALCISLLRRVKSASQIMPGA